MEDTKTLSYVKPVVQLSERDGNAFAIIGAVQAAMRKAGATQEELKEMVASATSGSYDHVLRTAMEYVEVE